MSFLKNTTKQIETDKKEETEHYLKTIFKDFLEGIKSINEVQNEVKRNLFIEASGANEVMIVDNKLTLEKWFIDNKFASKNVTISDESKAYIDDLFKNPA